ncbi:MAG: hypothetical protein JWO51_1940 [Rhodospirillales bacterium]|nr:hypothetical protein [Rhodospirillales bacterium]
MRLLRSSAFLAALAFAPLTLPQPASAAVFVSVQIAPPALPVYVQPPLPAPGYIWTPGYWAYADAGYYWVPGTWVLAPQPGLLWTPAYWGWNGGVYLFHAGYWGPHVGFYGGINYGFGYGGVGYLGGRWDHGEFAYNRTVNNVTITNTHNIYNQRVPAGPASRVSFNGGAGGLAARPTPAEEAVAHERHIEPTALQAHHQEAAAANRAQFASVNHGRPAVGASAQPGVMSGRGAVPARAAGGPVGNAARVPGPHPTVGAAGPRPTGAQHAAVMPNGPRAGGRPAAVPHAAAQGRPAPRPAAPPRAARPTAAPHPAGRPEERR